MSKKKKILLVVLLIIISIQFIRPDRNVTAGLSPGNITQVIGVPNDVQHILKLSCNDCHSNNTDYPWYSNVQPMGWILDNHINDGKAELNLDEFAAFSGRRRITKLKGMQNSIKDGSMPMASYTWLHAQAKLTEAKKNLVMMWLTKTIDSLTNVKNGE